MENKYTVYYHTFPNGRMYFGQTCQDVNDRWGKDGYGYMRQPLVWNAIKKYGWNNIEHRIISTGLDKDEADFQEMFYISAYKTNEREFGYNITDGGEGCTGVKHTYDVRMKISEALKGNKRMLGKHHTEETKKKIGEKANGRPSPNKGKVLSEETRRNMSESKKGENNPNYGKHLSEETRRKLSEKANGRQIQKWLTPDGSIREMNLSHVRRFHPDWVQIE